MSLNELAKEIHRNAVEHGWWEEDRGFAEVVALCHAELSEALEEYRDNHPMVWYRCPEQPNQGPHSCDLCPYELEECDVRGDQMKPEGIAVEMIDCMIRILDWCGNAGIDVDKVLHNKHEYNKTRPNKHGGKKI